MIYLHNSKGYGEDSDMSDGAEVSSGVKAFYCWVLREDRKKSREKKGWFHKILHEDFLPSTPVNLSEKQGTEAVIRM